MSKVTMTGSGKFVTYGLDGEKARNYVKYGLYVSDDDPRLRPPRRWWHWLAVMFR